MINKNSETRTFLPIFTVSFALLFLEIALIRWLSTEVRIFAYLSNLVLLACFVGMGAGCYFSNRQSRHLMILPLLTILIIATKAPWQVTLQGEAFHPIRDIPLMVSVFTDSPVWARHFSDAVMYSALLGFISTLAIFFIIVSIFFPLGQRLGKLLELSKSPIRAYSINVGASILGIWCFALFSFVSLPPVYWFILTALSLLAVWPSRIQFKFLLVCLPLIIAALLFFNQLGPDPEIWSPYQKLNINRYYRDGLQTGHGIGVNNTGYMLLLDLSDGFIQHYPELFDPPPQRWYCQYDLPGLLRPQAERALILGAGAGNDAAGMLRQSAKVIDAIEIDPGIYQFGKDFHPEMPYTNPRVTVHIDDARAFLRRANGPYDIISFGLLDAHTSASSYNNTRLDHFIYTHEALTQAWNLLSDDGILTLIFESGQHAWINSRFFGMLHMITDFDPLTVILRSDNQYGFGGVMFICPRNRSAFMDQLEQQPELHKFIQEESLHFPDPAVPITDDWPYLYLESRYIPPMYILVSLAIVTVLLIFGIPTLSRAGGFSPHFFFLGAAFMLLEFQNISKSTLLFGATWVVSAITITAILMLILAANMVVGRYKIKNIRPVYYALFSTLLILYIVPLPVLNALSPIPRAVFASFYLNLPIFFAGIIFIYSFARTQNRAIALGSNFIGAVCGGMLESLSFITGINALVILTLAFYLLAQLSNRTLHTATIHKT